MFQPLDMRKFVPWIIYVIFFGVLNETVFNVSTPKIAAQYDLSPTGRRLLPFGFYENTISPRRVWYFFDRKLV